MKLDFFCALKTVFLSLAISAAVLFVVSPASCKLTKDGIRLVTCDSVPELLSFKACSPRDLKFVFDRKVYFERLSLHEAENPGSPINFDCNIKEAECEKSMALESATEVGKSYTVEGIAGDENGNTLLFSVGFKGFNDSRAKIIIWQVRNAYSSKTNQYEYVKFYCVAGGNLSGYDFFTAADGEQKKFVFPDISVKEGDFITVHLRKMKDEEGKCLQDGMIDEVNGDKKASYAVDSSRDSWDFWVENQKSRIGPSDIIVLRNYDDGTICDAVLLADAKKAETEWNAKLKNVCNMVEQSGVWVDSEGQASADIEAAVACSGITSSAVKKSICRKNYDQPSCADDWYIKTEAKAKSKKKSKVR
ncbi:MAG: hypothetical protein K6G00_01720 [Treponema sp.]|nr:hypothetical protein [Treponema sp.]